MKKRNSAGRTAGNTTCCFAGAGYDSLQRKGWRSDDGADRADRADRNRLCHE